MRWANFIRTRRRDRKTRAEIAVFVLDPERNWCFYIDPTQWSGYQQDARMLIPWWRR